MGTRAAGTRAAGTRAATRAADGFHLILSDVENVLTVECHANVKVATVSSLHLHFKQSRPLLLLAILQAAVVYGDFA